MGMDISGETATNIELTRMPKREDFLRIIKAGEGPCACEPAMFTDAAKAEGLTCKPCAARFVLNGVVTLSERLEA